MEALDLSGAVLDVTKLSKPPLPPSHPAPLAEALPRVRASDVPGHAATKTSTRQRSDPCRSPSRAAAHTEKSLFILMLLFMFMYLLFLCEAWRMTLAGLEPAIFGSEDQRLIH